MQKPAYTSKKYCYNIIPAEIPHITGQEKNITETTGPLPA
jgi:hypothetical protein